MNLLDKLGALSFPPPTEPVAPVPRASILESLGYTDRNVPSIELPGRKTVHHSADLDRIATLPRRPRPNTDEFTELQDYWTARLGVPLEKCECESKYQRKCCRRMQPIQAWAANEMYHKQGLLGPISVGEGKTLLGLVAALVVPGVKLAVLLVKPSLREQLLKVDWHFYGQHYKLPNLAYEDGGQWYDPSKPTLRVISYSQLSSAKSSDLLEKELRPDLIIADEVQAIAAHDSARGKRFRRYMRKYPQTKFCAWSGTLTRNSIRNFAPFAEFALHEGSPLPISYPVVEEWAGALDPSDFPSNIGALKVLCHPGEDVRSGFRRRLEDTPGIVSSPATQNCTSDLVFYERKVILPEAVGKMVQDVYSLWQRPDEEELVDPLSVHRCAKELACGFYYRWTWPRGESKEVQEVWKAARKNWHKELREELKRSRPQMDSPLLCAKAAIRWHHGYAHIERDENGTEIGRYEIPPHSRTGPLPTWESEYWPEWERVRDTAKPETEGVWVDEWLARDAADWARADTGIVWYEHDYFGRRVAQLSGKPLYGAGEEASTRLLSERGRNAIVASIRAHGTGKNLQQFASNLVANPPSDAATWEQLLGRTHRQGQLADEVSVYLYRHAAPMVEALDKAKALARYTEDVLGGAQKLLRGNFAFDITDPTGR